MNSSLRRQKTRLFLKVDECSWECSPGDIIGREGTIAVEYFRGAAILSRRHLEVQFSSAGWGVSLCSTARNATWINDEEMLHGVRYPLRGRNIVHVEGLQFTFEIKEDQVVAAPQSISLPQTLEESGDPDDVDAILHKLPGCILIFDCGNNRLSWGNDAAVELLGHDELPSSVEAFCISFHREDETSLLECFAGLEDDITEYRRNLRVVESATGKVLRKLTLRFLKVAGHVIVCGDPDPEPDSDRSIAGLRLLSATYLSSEFQNEDIRVCFGAIALQGIEILQCDSVSIWLLDRDESSATPVAVVSAKASCNRDRVQHSYCPHYFDRVKTAPYTAFEAGASPTLSVLKELGYATEETAGILTVPVRGRNALGFVTFEWDRWDGELSEDASLSGLLLAGLCLSAATSVSHQRVLKELREREEQMAKELEDAEHYVRQVLPPPQSGTMDVSWFLKPCAQLGGDTFGYHWVDDDHFAIYLLDVVGHGTGAALLSISALNSVRAQILPDTDFGDPSAVLVGLNEAFQMETQNNMTFTIWYGIYCQSERKLCYSSAGHPPALLIDPSRANQCSELGTEGLIIGGLDGIEYRNADVEVPPGAKLYVLSDGAFEIEQPDGEMWPFEQFVAAVRATGSMQEGEVDYLYKRAQQVLEGNALQDDFTMLRIRFPQ